MATATLEVCPLEQLLLDEEIVTEKQLTRARRIAALLPESKPIEKILMEMGQLTHSDYERIVKVHRSRLSLAEILVQEGVLSAEGFEELERRRALEPRSTDYQNLVTKGVVAEEQFLDAVSTKHDIPLVEPEAGLVDMGLIQRTSLRYLLRICALPLSCVDGVINVILADPLNVETIAELERIFDAKVSPSCASSEKIRATLETLEKLEDRSAAGVESTDLQYREISDDGDQDEQGQGAVQIVDHLLTKSIQIGASDLHVEPMEGKVRVRVRIDGVLRKLTELPSEFAAQVISRMKVLASCDIAERRLHQDGRIFLKFQGREIDIRVSTYASAYGETVVMRILDRKRGLVPLDELGFEAQPLAQLREIVLKTSSGLVLITGPTGSGKTTTLYSFIDYVNDDTQKVITAEDPVEYVLAGTTQCTVNPKAGPTFPDSLRAMLRQDPDIIVVGEIRDQISASLAVESALTGHKVFSSLHTQDSVGAVVRLTDMGVKPFLVASTLSCIVAQRLMRRICPDCKTPATAAPDDLRFLGLAPADLRGIALFEGAGCVNCDGTGYKGRLGIHELLLPNDEFRDAIMSNASSKELKKMARELPAFTTLQENAVLKVMAGQTTLSEIAANAPRDENARKPAQLSELMTARRNG